MSSVVACILIVDDTPSARETLGAQLLPEGYRLEYAASGAEALERAGALKPDLILLDVMMPEMDGYEVCRRLRDTAELAEIPIVMVTSLDDRASRLVGLEAGADDFLSKPVDRAELRARVRTITRLNRYRLLSVERKEAEQERVRLLLEVTQAYDATIEAWSLALEIRDLDIQGHCRRVAEMTVKVAAAMGLAGDDLVHIRRGAFLHDIGKIALPDSILRKPGPLTHEEWESMRRHPEVAYELLSKISFLRPAITIPYCHHEKWDGSGYPRGLAGEEIPLAARIFTVVDVWDALSSERSYNGAWNRADVTAYCRDQAGSHFDPQVVDAFLGVLEREPSGPVGA